MDLLTSIVNNSFVEPFHQLTEFYAWSLTLSDRRVEGWLLMDSVLPTFYLTLLYLVIVYTGPKLMREREAYNLSFLLVIYNFILVALNFYIMISLAINTTKAGYSYISQPVHYGDDPTELNIAKALWWYYFSKVIEYLDTIFFILRKKNSQVTFLHVYHHCTMFPLWWIGIKWVPGGQSFFPALINSFVHVVMYSYYGVSALGPDYQKYLWWKKYITTLQLVQFVLGICHCIHSVTFGCNYPVWMSWLWLFYSTSFLLLFLNFYSQTYRQPKQNSTAILNKKPFTHAIAAAVNDKDDDYYCRTKSKENQMEIENSVNNNSNNNDLGREEGMKLRQRKNGFNFSSEIDSMTTTVNGSVIGDARRVDQT